MTLLRHIFVLRRENFMWRTNANECDGGVVMYFNSNIMHRFNILCCIQQGDAIKNRLDNDSHYYPLRTRTIRMILLTRFREKWVSSVWQTGCTFFYSFSFGLKKGRSRYTPRVTGRWYVSQSWPQPSWPTKKEQKKNKKNENVYKFPRPVAAPQSRSFALIYSSDGKTRRHRLFSHINAMH